MIKKTQNIIIFIAIAFVLTGSLLYYTNYNVKLLKQDYEYRISKLNEEMQDNIGSLRSSVLDLGNNLSSQIGLVDKNLQNFKKQNQQEIKTLSDLIDEIEQQSNIRLSELKNELKNIQIKSADFSAIVDDVLQSVVSISTNVGQGSGVIIERNGYIVTNLHVISGASAIRATLYSGKTYNVNILVGYGAAADIAVLKIDAPDLQALSFGDSDDVKVGEKVIAAGNPAGLSFTVTEGIVSAFRTFNGIRYIQIDVPINPGNSGGPLVNAKAEIIGINNFKVGGFESLGFAVSSNKVRNVVTKIISEYEAKQKQ